MMSQVSAFDSEESVNGKSGINKISNLSSSSDPEREYWKRRREILLKLKNCVLKLTPFVHRNVSLDESFSEATDLCEAIEVVFFYGIKIIEFRGIIPLWGLLERLECSSKPSIPLRNAVGAVACMDSLRTPLAKSRAFIRQILNTKTVDVSFLAIVGQQSHQHIHSSSSASTAAPQQTTTSTADMDDPFTSQRILTSFYHDHSILCQSEDIEILMAIFRSIKVYSFNFRVDHPELNTPPVYLKTLFAMPKPTASSSNGSSNANNTLSGSAKRFVSSASTATATASTDKSNNTDKRRGMVGAGTGLGSNSNAGAGSSAAGTGQLVDYLFGSLDYGFDMMFSKVDIAAKFIEEHYNSNETELAAAGVSNSSRDQGSSQGGANFARRFVQQQQQDSKYFGASLKDLIMNEKYCSHANLDPRVGIPNHIVKLLSVIQRNISWKGLFRSKADVSTLAKIRSILDSSNKNPNMSASQSSTSSFDQLVEDPVTAAQCLIMWLSELPEPLFGFQHYDAVLACQEVEDVPSRVRNLSILIQETNWYNKPLLVKLIRLLNQCVQPEVACKNGLNAVFLSVLFTPFFLRPLSLSALGLAKTEDEIDHIHMSAAAAGGNLFQFLLQHPEVVSPVETYTSRVQAQLAAKCLRARGLQESAAKGYTPTYSASLHSPDEHEDEHDKEDSIEHCKKLFCLLKQPHSFIAKAKLVDNNINDVNIDVDVDVELLTISELLGHPRWKVCGFSGITGNGDDKDHEHEPVPLQHFQSSGGLLGIICLNSFLEKYETRASLIVVEYAENRLQYFSIAQVANELAKFVAQLLNLTPHPESDDKPIQYMAKCRHTWNLMNSPNIVQEVFDIAMLAFEDCWNHLKERNGISNNFPSSSSSTSTSAYALLIIETKSILQALIAEPKVSSIAELWDYWLQIRLSKFESLFALQQQQPTRPTASPSISPATSAKLSSSSSSSSSGTTVIGGSTVLTKHQQIVDIETALPDTHKCRNWRLLYRLSRDGSSLQTVNHRAKKLTDFLVVMRDNGGTQFGGFIVNRLGLSGDKYYGNSETAVFSFLTGFKFYRAATKNNYYLLSSDKLFAMGGGGNFAIYLDGELNHGTSGPCATFSSPCLASQGQFICTEFELFSLELIH